MYLEKGQGKDVLPNWDEMKKEEKRGKRDQRSELEAVPRAFPALIRAEKVQKKLEKGNYSRPESPEEISRSIKNSLKTLEEGKDLSEKRAEEEIGKLLYRICEISGKYGVHPEEALTSVVDSKIRQFRFKS